MNDGMVKVSIQQKVEGSMMIFTFVFDEYELMAMNFSPSEQELINQSKSGIMTPVIAASLVTMFARLLEEKKNGGGQHAQITTV